MGEKGTRGKQTKHRLMPLETLYKERKMAEKTPVKPVFIKPGKEAKIPESVEESPAVRYLKTTSIKNDIKFLEPSLKDIESDTTFVANAMASALQVPKAIESTFNRIHGRIYDIEREIEYNDNSTDDNAAKIQKVFRGYAERQHFQVVKDAVDNTIRRDCAPIHQALLGFLVSYSKRDDQFRMLLNRRFLGRNRAALKYWRQWSIVSREQEESTKGKVKELQSLWLQRISRDFLKKWKFISFSKHSRKNLRLLHQKITAEAQKRLTERSSDVTHGGRTILEMLQMEREVVIIEFGLQNYKDHMKSLVFRLWRRFVEQCRKESRSGNAIARQFWISRKKKSFFTAWYSLSVGRVVVFGGYSQWIMPKNRLREKYEEEFTLKSEVIQTWRWIVKRKKLSHEFRQQQDQKFLLLCFRALRACASKRRESLAKMMETYLKILRHRLHHVFSAWHHYVAKESIRKQPSTFILSRSSIYRSQKAKRTCFYRWLYKFHISYSKRQHQEERAVEGFTSHWKSAGEEMQGSLVLINDLTGRLQEELERRRADLTHTMTYIAFLNEEQSSLAFAAMNTKTEIDKLHARISKSAMRYFVDLKPVHEKVVADVPGALQHYLQMKEEEKKRALAEKQSLQAPGMLKKATPSSRDMRRRKTTFTNKAPKVIERQNSRVSSRSRRSVDNSGPFGISDIKEDHEE